MRIIRMYSNVININLSKNKQFNYKYDINYLTKIFGANVLLIFSACWINKQSIIQFRFKMRIKEENPLNG